MIAAVVALALVCALQTVALVLIQRMHVAETRLLVDRIVARHVGEVIALDRDVSPKPPTPESNKRTYLEGVS